MKIDIKAKTQIAAAYGQMADDALYRPAIPDEYLDPDSPVSSEEVERYIEAWWEQEEDNAGQFWIGLVAWPHRWTQVLTIEAAKLLSAGDAVRAAELLKLATKRLDGYVASSANEREREYANGYRAAVRKARRR